MREQSLYISTYFMEKVWNKFSYSLKRERTRNDYFSTICDICDYLSCDFINITPNGAQSFFDKLSGEHKLTIKTINTKLSYLRSLSSYMYDIRQELDKDDYLTPFISVNITGYSTYLDPGQVPSKASIDTLLHTCKDDSTMFLIISLVVRCSLTATQICSILTNKITIDGNNTCSILFPGNSSLKDKRICVPADVATILYEYMNEHGQTEWLFNNKSGKRLRLRTLQSMMAKVAEDAGLSGITLQDLRNSSIALMLHGGAPAAKVSAYSNIAPRWIYRFDRVIEEIKDEPCDYMHLTIHK